MHDPYLGIPGEPPVQPTYQPWIAFDRDDARASRRYFRGNDAGAGAQIEDEFARPDIGLSDQPGSRAAGKEVRTVRCGYGRRSPPTRGHGRS